MSEPIREQLAKAVEELDEWIKGDRTLWNEMHGSVTGDYENQFVNTQNADNAQKIALAAKVNALTALLSPVGETEAAKLPLDPEPWALLVNTDIRYSSNLLIASAQRVIFTPRPGYSQDLADYSDVAPRLELDRHPWIEDSNGVGAHHSWTVNCDGYGCKFAPRPGYSQIEGDYR